MGSCPCGLSAHTVSYTLSSRIMNTLEIQETIKAYFPNLEESTLLAFVKYSSYLKSPKGTKLISEGKRHHYFYLIIKGGAKSYYSKDSKEVCMWFAFENEVIGTMTTYEGLPSKAPVELTEDSEVLKVNIDKIKELAQTNLSANHVIIDLIKEHTLYMEDRIYHLQFMTSEDRYKRLLERTPEILQKVSITDIATYLGVSRETLSRIRAKK